MAKFLWWTLLIYSLVFAVVYIKDVFAHRDEWDKETSFIKSGLIGFGCLFFDVLGIGAYAPHTFLYRSFKQVKDQVIPATLNVGNALPTVLQALIFIGLIQVEPITLFSMIAASVVGSWIGAKFVIGFSESKVQISMGIALLITAVFMFLGFMGISDLNNTAIGLSGLKLLIAIVVNFILGALMTIGVGLYSPCMALVSVLGMSVTIAFPIMMGSKLLIAIVVNFILGALMTIGVGLYSPCMALVSVLGMSVTIAFPIMMGSCAFLMPTCGLRFIQSGKYNRKAALASTIFGSVGVLLAAFLVKQLPLTVKQLPLTVLKWLVLVVVLITAFRMLVTGIRNYRGLNLEIVGDSCEEKC